MSNLFMIVLTPMGKQHLLNYKSWTSAEFPFKAKVQWVAHCSPFQMSVTALQGFWSHNTQRQNTSCFDFVVFGKKYVSVRKSASMGCTEQSTWFPFPRQSSLKALPPCTRPWYQLQELVQWACPVETKNICFSSSLAGLLVLIETHREAASDPGVKLGRFG